MTIKELKDKIELLDESLEVIISEDSEGNEFHFLRDVENEQKYFDSYGFYVEVISKEDLEDYDEDYDEETLKDCIVLWP